MGMFVLLLSVVTSSIIHVASWVLMYLTVASAPRVAWGKVCDGGPPCSFTQPIVTGDSAPGTPEIHYVARAA